MSSAFLFRKTTQWFDRAKANLLDNLPCRQGCSHCCIGLFPVTLLDCLELQRGLESLPTEDRQRVEGKAREQVSLLQMATSRLTADPFIDVWSDQEIDKVIDQFGSLPCPALDKDGRCGLYEFRPLACRSMGIPPDDGRSVVGACAVQTSVPLVRLSPSLRDEEHALARLEADQLEKLRVSSDSVGEEVFLPYAFSSEFRIRSGKGMS